MRVYVISEVSVSPFSNLTLDALIVQGVYSGKKQALRKADSLLALNASFGGEIQCEGDELQAGDYVSVCVMQVDGDKNDPALQVEQTKLREDLRSLENKYRRTIDMTDDDTSYTGSSDSKIDSECSCNDTRKLT